MKPPEEEIRELVAEWVRKADLDFKTVVRLSANDSPPTEGKLRESLSPEVDLLHG